MSNLNKERRLQIIESVYKSTHLPAQKHDITERTRVEVRRVMMATLPKDFNDAVKNLPKNWFSSIEKTGIQRPFNPIGIMQWFETEQDLKNAWRSPAVTFAPFIVPHSHHHISIEDSMDYAKRNHQDPNKTWEFLLQDLIKEATKVAEAEKAMRTELRHVLLSVTTYKKLLEIMPDLERHLPGVPAKSYPVAAPTFQLNKLLDKLGFDTGVP